MKKLIAGILVTAMLLGLAGCAALDQFFCSPTAQQQEAANVAINVANAIFTAAGTYSGNSTLEALAQEMTVFYQVATQGYCVAQADWDTAVTALNNAEQATPSATVKIMAALPNFPNYDAAYAFISGQKWSY